MNPLAESWYATSTSLAVEAIAVSVVLGLAAMWATFRSANPRRELTYRVGSVVPVVTRGKTVRGRSVVETRLNGRVLNDPRIVVVHVRNRGRRDVPTSAFDKGRPLRLDVGAPIAEILERVSTPAEYLAPAIEADGTTLAIGPDLIKKGQSVTVSFLVEGAEPCLAVQGSPFIDVVVRRDPGRLEKGLTWAVYLATALLVAMAVAIAVWADPKTSSALPWVVSTGVLAVMWVVLIFALGGVENAELRASGRSRNGQAPR